MRRQVDELIVALGAAAEQAAREAGRPAIKLPEIGADQDPAAEIARARSSLPPRPSESA